MFSKGGGYDYKERKWSANRKGCDKVPPMGQQDRQGHGASGSDQTCIFPEIKTQHVNLILTHTLAPGYEKVLKATSLQCGHAGIQIRQ